MQLFRKKAVSEPAAVVAVPAAVSTAAPDESSAAAPAAVQAAVPAVAPVAGAAPAVPAKKGLAGLFKLGKGGLMDPKPAKQPKKSGEHSVLDRHTLLVALPAIPWMAPAAFFSAVALVVLAGLEARDLAQSSRAVSYTTVSNYKIERVPISSGEAKKIIEVLQRRHPKIIADEKNGEITVGVKDGTMHTDWLYAVNSLQAAGGDVIWDASEFCVGRCKRFPAIVTVKGFRQKLVAS